MKQVLLKAEDGTELDVHVFPAPDPKAAIQIIHGMEEYQERYEDFAEYLNSCGFSVVTSDLRGHGRRAELLGHIADENGSELLVGDQKTVREFISGEFPELPVFLFAHSMGTMIARNMLKKDSADYGRTVLCGYPNYQSAAGFGRRLTSFIGRFRGPRGKDRMLEYLCVGAFNRGIKNPSTPIDWLSVNEENVRNYAKDPLCGQGFTVGSFETLFDLMEGMHSIEGAENVSRNMPMLLISGAEDPCTGGEKGRADSLLILRKLGFEHIEVRVFEGMRHEILNETERQKVYETVSSFLTAKEPI